MTYTPIIGQKISLVPAQQQDKYAIFEWMALVDTSSAMLGPPLFPEIPVPSWEEFDKDYEPYYFSDDLPLMGRCFVIQLDGKAIGQINYNEINVEEKQVELDIWLAGSQYTGQGFGTDAILSLCDYLRKEYDCKRFVMAPSARNPRAVRTYQKAGFKVVEEIPMGVTPEYRDTVVMVKEL